jgi:hypothetical protein
MVPVRISLTEVRAHDFIYTFDRSEDADGFIECLASQELGECELRFQAIDKRRVRVEPDDFAPGA